MTAFSVITRRISEENCATYNKAQKALLLVTAGDDEDDGYNIIEKQVKLSFSVMNTELVGGVLAKDTDNGGVKEDDLRRAFELSKIIYG